MSRRLLIVMFLTALMLPRYACADVSLPKPMRDDINLALTISEDFSNDEWRSVKKPEAKTASFARFSQVMDALAGQVGSELTKRMMARESDDIDAKLITIACYRKNHPDLYNELLTGYVYRKTNPGGRADNMPDAPQQFTTEKYRLLWEYLILAPNPPGVLSLYKLRTAQALTRIRNEASLPTLVHLFGYTVAPDMPAATGPLANQQTTLIGHILAYPGQRGLSALMACVELWWKKPHPSLRRDSFSSTTGDEEIDIPRLIAESTYGETFEKFKIPWLRAIEVYPYQDVKPEYIHLLGGVQAAWQKIQVERARQEGKRQQN